MFKVLRNLKKVELTLTKTSQNLTLTRSFVIKCDDLNKPTGQKTKDEILRCKLAATYRLVGKKGWDMGIYNHITVRSEENPEHFLINPFGLTFQEINASSLVKINSECDVIEKGSTSYGVNRAGFTLHSAIHDARPDINAVIHVHTAEAAGISTLKSGLLPISQEAIICIAGGVGYHDYEGILIDEDMKKVIINDLGPRKILMLRNHGAAFCGATIEECFFWLYTFMNAVKTQHVAMSSANGVENLIIVPERVVDQIKMVLQCGVSVGPDDGLDWGIGDLDFEAEMRQLDNEGYNTGYPYKKP